MRPFGSIANAALVLTLACIATPLWVQAAEVAPPTEAPASVTAPGGADGLGPNSVQTQVGEIEATRKKVEPYWPSIPSFDQYGLSLAADYNMLYQQVSSSPGDDSAASGVARFYGTWAPVNPNSANAGKLIFKVEHRHRLGADLAPQALFPTAGVAGLSAVPWSDRKALLTNLYWAQRFANNRFGFVAGVVDSTDYTDVYGLVNPWTDFNNLAFSNNPTIPFPSQGLGAAVHWLFTSNYYVLGGIADANGDPHKPGDFFHSFFDTAEYFKHIEFGQIGSWERRFSDNTHITYWQVDRRKTAGVDDGWGIALSWSHQFGKWLPFFRAGYADGGGPPVDRSISAGTGYALNERGDYLGFGASWGRAPAPSTGGDTQNQYTLETYYRLQFLKHLQITPGVQYIGNPAYNQAKDSLWLFSLRVRATF